MTINYPRYELTVSISERISWDETKLMVQTTTGISDTTDREGITKAAIDLVDFSLFEGWGEVLNEEQR